MGYTTDFDGQFDIKPALKLEHLNYLNKFSETRRMKRRAKETAKMPDPVREAVGLGIGQEGGFFVGAQDYCGQAHTPDIIDYNAPPAGQPGLWCQWTPTEDGLHLEWNGTGDEKSTWKVVATIKLNDPEPDWEKLEA